MNKQQQIEAEKQKIVEARKRISELERESEYLRKPKSGEIYFTPVDRGDYIDCSDDWTDHECDEFRLATGDVFTKQEHAQAKANSMRRYGRLERLIIEFNAETGWEPDWSDRNQPKGRLLWSHDSDGWFLVCDCGLESVGQPVFDYSRTDELLAAVNKHFPKGFES